MRFLLFLELICQNNFRQISNVILQKFSFKQLNNKKITTRFGYSNIMSHLVNNLLKFSCKTRGLDCSMPFYSDSLHPFDVITVGN